ncbi:MULTISPECIES: hypothetical protein [Clostridium]|nr:MULTISPECIES: hypothetical protein [Clostridium]
MHNSSSSLLRLDLWKKLAIDTSLLVLLEGCNYGDDNINVKLSALWVQHL